MKYTKNQIRAMQCLLDIGIALEFENGDKINTVTYGRWIYYSPTNLDADPLGLYDNKLPGLCSALDDLEKAHSQEE